MSKLGDGGSGAVRLGGVIGAAVAPAGAGHALLPNAAGALDAAGAE